MTCLNMIVLTFLLMWGVVVSGRGCWDKCWSHTQPNTPVLLTEDDGRWDDCKFNITPSGELTVHVGIQMVSCLSPELHVNSSITNEEECKKLSTEILAKERNMAIHTCGKERCVRDNRQNFDIKPGEYPSCQTVSLSYNYVFTGCYALLSKNNLLKSFFVTSPYKRTEIVRPTRPHIFGKGESIHMETTLPDDNAVTEFKMSLNYKFVKQKHSCTISKNTTKIPCRVENNTTTPGSCIVKREVQNESPRRVKCTFDGLNQNVSACLVIKVQDERCKPQNCTTIWNPPHIDRPNEKRCYLIINCVNLSPPPSSPPLAESSSDADPWQVPIIVLTIVLAIIFVTVIGVLVYWRFWMGGRFGPDSPNGLDIENRGRKSCGDTGKEMGKHSGIVLLYARDSAPFMKLMTTFRDMLQRICGCQVYDMYAVSEFNKVATVGVQSWVESMLKGGRRAVWVDTPRGRYICSAPQMDIDDFRDGVLPLALNFAKCALQDTVKTYRRHFVIRFEGLEAGEDTNDPFAIISPHVRYIMPEHVIHLWKELSSSGIISVSEEEAEKQRLRKELIAFLTTTCSLKTDLC